MNGFVDRIFDSVQVIIMDEWTEEKKNNALNISNIKSERDEYLIGKCAKNNRKTLCIGI